MSLYLPPSLLAVALVFGLLVSAVLYFVLLWPRREPIEPGREANARPPGADAPGADH
ncbi:MAG: hypothetical protein Tsb0020_28990 [Haliangiales bacterium]